MQSLSQSAVKLIKKQSLQSGGGDSERDCIILLFLFGELIEPDAFDDDLAIRYARDISQHSCFNPQDPQPLFGVPLLGELAASACTNRKDYLHQIPDGSKYRSTFHPMRNPDTVKDDLAFRALRKDGNTSNDPDSLGIFKDPNMPSYTSSCCNLIYCHPNCASNNYLCMKAYLGL
jgi:hypothetical protein